MTIKRIERLEYTDCLNVAAPGLKESSEIISWEDAKSELESRVLVDLFVISANTLRMMDKSIENLKMGRVSEPIDLSVFQLQ